MIEEEDDPYMQCSCFNDDVCGPFRRWEKKGLFAVNSLENDIIKYLQGLQLQTNINIDEKTLIEDRLKQELPTDGYICAFHRYSLGIAWKCPVRCLHPNHTFLPGKKAPALRVLPIDTLKIFNIQNSTHLPIGTKFCFQHIKAATALKYDKGLTTSPPSPLIERNTPHHDQDYVPGEMIISDETIAQASSSANLLCSGLDSSPLPYQIKQKKVSDLSESTKEKLRQKFARMQHNLEQKFAETVAPGQSAEFIDQVLNISSFDDKQEHDIPHDLKIPLKMYPKSDAFGKLVILSLVDHKKYSKTELMNLFKCSRYQVDEARKLQTEKYLINVPVKEKKTRLRAPQEKVEHFLEFLFANGLLQDVAYGINRIKFDNGKKQDVANAIITMKYSHAISFYKEQCSNNLYKPLSDSSLWKILHGIKPSQQKALAGLDDITAAGMNGFSLLQEVAEKQLQNKSLSKSFEKAKRYLKGNFLINCNVESDCRSHSTLYALSDISDADLSGPSLKELKEECHECVNLFESLDQIEDFVHSQNDDELEYDVKIAKDNILAFMKHQVRDSQQKQAKRMVFQHLDGETGFWLKDYCQKILPSKYREGQKEYFGKKGMSLHVDILFLKRAGQLIKKVYFTALYRCDQSLSDSLCLATIILEKMKLDFPKLQYLYAKSDNASSYHGNYYLEALFGLCQKKKIVLKRYDYNEPCRGKDQCDRESAGAKSLMRSYIDAGNDILTAEDIHQALQYGNGINNAEVAVAAINKDNTILTGNATIPKISQYHSFEFHDDYMLMWRYFQIGAGKKWNYSSVAFKPAISISKSFIMTSKNFNYEPPKKNPRMDRQICHLFPCLEQSCIQTFHSIEQLEAHMLSEVHTENADVRSMVDRARKSYVQRMQSSHETVTLQMNKENKNEKVMRFTAVTNNLLLGWALPVRKQFRYTDKQKTLLLTMFLEGEKTGKKMSPDQVHQQLRKKLDVAEYVTSQQIRSLFSRWSRLQREGKLPSKDDFAGDETVSNEENGMSNESLISEVAEELVNEHSVNDWIVVKYKEEWYPGVIQKLQNHGFEVQCMEKRGKNLFRWPLKDDILFYCYNDVLLHQLQPIVPVNNRGDYRMEESDVEQANKNMRKYSCV